MIKVTLDIAKQGDARKHLEKVAKALAGPTQVKVGFPSGKTPSDLVKIAFWNHEGTNRARGEVFRGRNGKTGISGPIPARPFIAVAMFKGRGEIKAFLRAEAKAIFNAKQTMAGTLPRLGLKGQGLIQAQMTSNMGPPNSAMTVFLKGSSGTLIDKGRLSGSVTWKIDA